MSSTNIVMGSCRSSTLPDDLRSHPLVQGTWFYALPKNLLDSLKKFLGDKFFDAKQFDAEKRLAQAAEVCSSCVGFRDGNPIADAMLRPPAEISTTDPVTKAFLLQCQEAGHCDANFLNIVSRRRDGIVLPVQGYLGWLWTSQIFRSEFQQLVEAHPSIFADAQEPPQPIVAAAAIPGLRKDRGKKDLDTTVAIQEFCRRWRLKRIVATAVVEPLMMYVPSPQPQLNAYQAQSSGTLVYVPDIAPLPSREELRELLEENVRHSANDAEHLQEWIELVRSDTQGKKPIARYARWYPLQHYCSVLFFRYGKSLVGHKKKVEEAFSEFFEVSDSTIECDFIDISRRLGPLWYETSPALVTPCDQHTSDVR